MKVAISVGGRFHAFDMARQLHRRKYLAQLITSYPKSKVGEWGIPRGLVRTVLSHEFLSRGWRLLARRLGWRSDPQFDFNDRYDRIAARRLLAGADITVAWSGMALQTLRVAQELGSWAVLERNSSHIQYQSDLMKEEYERLGWEPRLPDRRMIERELAEYEAADAICVPSTFACRSFVQRGVAADKLMMVPFGVSIEQFQPLAVEESPFRIIFCGALSIRKGLHYLLQAFQELDLPDAELWLVGPPTAE
ncbi:MAG: glycosyltransferase family 4 protein, partial [Bryobacterales bacterium]|nr:glycosyltransferase family 4 protein [Bryobacterales bacterium]